MPSTSFLVLQQVSMQAMTAGQQEQKAADSLNLRTIFFCNFRENDGRNQRVKGTLSFSRAATDRECLRIPKTETTRRNSQVIYNKEKKKRTHFSTRGTSFGSERRQSRKNQQRLTDHTEKIQQINLHRRADGIQ